MSQQLEYMLLQSSVLTKQVSTHLNWIDEEDRMLLSSLFLNVINNLESLVERYGISVDYSDQEHTPRCDDPLFEDFPSESQGFGQEKAGQTPSRGAYTELHIVSDDGFVHKPMELQSTLPIVQIHRRINTGTNVFDGLSFVEWNFLNTTMLIPFDKTLNLDVVQFIDRIRTTPQSEVPSNKEKEIFLTNTARNLTNGRLAYKNGSKTFTLSLTKKVREKLPDLQVYFDEHYHDNHQNRDRNIFIVENRYIFYISYKQVRMIDINQLRDIDRSKWCSLFSSSDPGTFSFERNSVCIFVDHRDRVLYSMDEVGGYSVYRLPNKHEKLASSFNDLDLLATRESAKQNFHPGKFTCITGRSALVAVANFNPHTRTVGLFLFQGSRKNPIALTKIKSSVPIHTMQLTKVDGMRLLLTSDYEGVIRVFAAISGDLVLVETENIKTIEEIKITSDSDKQYRLIIPMIEYLCLDCLDLDFNLKPEIRFDEYSRLRHEEFFNRGYRDPFGIREPNLRRHAGELDLPGDLLRRLDQVRVRPL